MNQVPCLSAQASPLGRVSCHSRSRWPQGFCHSGSWQQHSGPPHGCCPPSSKPIFLLVSCKSGPSITEAQPGSTLSQLKPLSEAWGPRRSGSATHCHLLRQTVPAQGHTGLGRASTGGFPLLPAHFIFSIVFAVYIDSFYFI